MSQKVTVVQLNQKFGDIRSLFSDNDKDKSSTLSKVEFFNLLNSFSLPLSKCNELWESSSSNNEVSYSAYIQVMREIYALILEREANSNSTLKPKMGQDASIGSPTPSSFSSVRQRSGSNVSSSSSLSQSSGSVAHLSASSPNFSPQVPKLLITEQEKLFYESIFNNISAGTGQVTLEQVKPTFTQSKLDPNYLWSVWQLCNVGAKEFITKEEFFYAIYFIEKSKISGNYIPLPSSISQLEIEIFQDAGQPTNEIYTQGAQIPPVTEIASTMASGSIGDNENVSNSAAQTIQARVNELLQETRLINQDMLRINSLSEMSKSQYDEAKAQVNILQESIHTYQLDIEKVIKERNHIQSELFTLRAQIELLNRDNNTFTSQLATTQKQISELLSEKELIEKENKKLVDDVGNAKKKFGLKSAELENLRQLILNKKSENETLKQQISTQEVSSDIENEIQRMKNELAEIEKENSRLKLEALKVNDLDDLKKEKMEIQQKLVNEKKKQKDIQIEINSPQPSSGRKLPTPPGMYIPSTPQDSNALEQKRDLPSNPPIERRELPPPPMNNKIDDEFDGFGEGTFGDGDFGDFDNAFNDDFAFENAFNSADTGNSNSNPPVGNKDFSDAFDDDDDWGDF